MARQEHSTRKNASFRCEQTPTSITHKVENDREGEETELDFNLGFQNPTTLSANTLVVRKQGEEAL